ncbi:MAG: hydantoinase/oxoprolinase family protein [Candidatus Aminicenantes bacterium]|jgi:N-methylhydantoinase A/oxoprolinase/acetone carboxylase beta subunit
MRTEIRIGVDTGGTFTDFVFFADGGLGIKKVPSTPKNPSLAIHAGIEDYLRIPFSPFIIHGTTVATNALLERKGGRISLITTEGFEDILFIGRQTRKHLYSLKGEQRIPLLPRKRCFGLDERTTAAGIVEKQISVDALNIILDKIIAMNTEAVAVSLINSYANGSNEKIIKDELEKKALSFSISSEILPEHREYERTSVTAVNAYLIPVISRYLSNLELKLSRAKLRIMQSNEGYISPSTAKANPIRTALSGPAGGVVAAYHLGKAGGERNLITFDMGGTSSDVSLLDGQIRRTNESIIGDFPVRMPLIDIHSVGAGGGSIAYLDRGGSLRVGPQSAGAHPGPACYGVGYDPTVTDANLVLGRLVPDFFLGGQMKIYPERSRKAINKIAERIGKTAAETAEGIIEIANATMEKAIRVISIERGFDPRGFTLFSFGGAGGMHAVDIASHLQMPKVIVPKNAGVLSALGLLLADSIKDYSNSVLKKTISLKKGELNRLLSRLKKKSVMEMEKEGFEESQIKLFPSLDLRYLGQSYEITLPLTDDGQSIESAFHRAHQKMYSYHHPDRPVEIVNIRIKAVGTTKKIRFRRYPLQNTEPFGAQFGNQEIIYARKKHQAPLYKRSQLQPKNRIEGPALIVDLESTTLLPPGWNLDVDRFFNLIIRRKKNEDLKL